MNKVQNIEFAYLYRDGGNFKNFGNVVFSNLEDIDTEFLLKAISEALVDGTFFEARAVEIPNLFFEHLPFDPDLDHGWHEFERLQATPAAITDEGRRDIGNFIAQMREARRRTSA